MKRCATVISGVAGALLLCTSVVLAQKQYPVSVGVSFGNWTPSLTQYNTRFVEQAASEVIVINGREVEVRIRQPLDAITADTSISGFLVSKIPFTYVSQWGFGLNARLRLHNDLFALVEYDWWSQSVGSVRNYGGYDGYEQFDLTLNPVTVSLLYQLPQEARNKWWPKFYIGVGGGAVIVKRTVTQVTSSTLGGGSITTGTGSGALFVGLGGVDYTIPIAALEDRVSLFFEGRYITGTYNEEFAVLGPTGGATRDSLDNEVRVAEGVSIVGPHMKFGMSVSFGQIRTRSEKGVLSGLIEGWGKRRSSGGFATAAMSGGYGYASAAAPAGMAVIYPQQASQVQVVEGAGRIDEDRIRQIIRQELLGARMGAGAPSPKIDTLAEDQLRSIKLRRMQAEQELKRLKELLREEG
jgi:hypothetical protein